MTAFSAHQTATTQSRSDHQASATVVIAAVAALVASVPLATMIAGPLAGISAQNGRAGTGAALTFTLLVPFVWMIFAAAVWTTMRGRASERVLAVTMRAVSATIMPWIVLSLIGLGWTAGPQASILAVATFSVPVAAIGAAFAAATAR